MIRDQVVGVTGFKWIDIESPSEEDLEKLSQEFQFPLRSLKDCLQPDHLPKYEYVEGIHFLILRFIDEQASQTAKSIQALTRKVAVFQNSEMILTIHRSEISSWTQFKNKKRNAAVQSSTDDWVCQMMKVAFRSFENFLMKSEEKLSQVSAMIFATRHHSLNLEKFHHATRKIAIIRRILRMQLDMVSDFEPYLETAATYQKDAHEEGERMYFFADDLYEAQHLTLQTYFSQSAHRTNEIMRVMTLFSAFFLPVTFIAGVYGMNFDQMPELRHPAGYYATLAAMSLVSVGIALWARKKGWFQKS